MKKKEGKYIVNWKIQFKNLVWTAKHHTKQSIFDVDDVDIIIFIKLYCVFSLI